MLRGALIVGGAGFNLGSWGPPLRAPGEIQGPLLGIFTLGPQGFLAGALGGAIRWQQCRRRLATCTA
jgi:hypothetical protein